MIEININLVFTIINLIVLYLLMKKFLFGPILNVMEQRKNMIDQQFASAKDTEEQEYDTYIRSETRDIRDKTAVMNST